MISIQEGLSELFAKSTVKKLTIIWALPSNSTLEQMILPPKGSVIATYLASAILTGR